MIRFKSDLQRQQFFRSEVSRDIKLMTCLLAAWIEGRFGHAIVITGVLPEAGVTRVSQTHADGRAIDIRTRDWKEGAPHKAEEWLCARFHTGVTFPDGRPLRPALYHNSGYGSHLHLQVGAGHPLKIGDSNTDAIVI